MQRRQFVRFVLAVVVLWILFVVARSFRTEPTARPEIIRPSDYKPPTSLDEYSSASPLRKPHKRVFVPPKQQKQQQEAPEQEQEQGDATQQPPQQEQQEQQEQQPQHGKKKKKQQTNLDAIRRDAVVDAIKLSWRGYKKYAWGFDEYRPLSKRGSQWADGQGIGATIVDALDTLIISEQHESVEEAIDWISTKLSYKQPIKLSVFETTIRIVGGLISAYQRTGRKVLLDRAVDLADRLLPAFNTDDGIPDNYVHLTSGHHEGAAWIGGAAILSELGSVQLEMRVLSHLTNDPKYDAAGTKAFMAVRPHCSSGFCPKTYRNGRGVGESAGLGSFGDSFYEYLLKQWLLTGKTEGVYKEMWDKAADHVIATSKTYGPKNLFVPNGEETGGTMEHLACFSAGLFALSYHHTKKQEHLDVAEKIATTCHEMYVSTPTGLSPDVAHVRSDGTIASGEPKYILRPETVESYFYLWKVTKNTKYRDWGYDVLQACNKYLLIDDAGYVGSLDVYRKTGPKNDNMETFWLAETLKYLYLLFSEDELFDLDEWVINTEAHPFKVFRPGQAAPPHRSNSKGKRKMEE